MVSVELSGGVDTLNRYFARFETPFLDTEKTFIVGYYDRDDGYAGLNREMEGSLFEGEHYRTVGVGSCSFREYPHTLLKQVSFAYERMVTFFCFICFTALSKVLSADVRFARSMKTVPLSATNKVSSPFK